MNTWTRAVHLLIRSFQDFPVIIIKYDSGFSSIFSVDVEMYIFCFITLRCPSHDTSFVPNIFIFLFIHYKITILRQPSILFYNCRYTFISTQCFLNRILSLCLTMFYFLTRILRLCLTVFCGLNYGVFVFTFCI